MIVLVTGGRKYFNRNHVHQVLDAIHSIEEVTILLEGGARGADSLGYDWAAENEVDSFRCRAKWTSQRKAAGMIRNARMLEVMGQLPDMVVVFPGGTGTEGMLNLVKEINKASGEEVIDIIDEREMSI